MQGWKDQSIRIHSATSGTSHIMREVLQYETLSLTGGDHSWLKRGSTREKIRVIREIIIIIIITIIPPRWDSHMHTSLIPISEH
jgi:hypothetical protein